MCLAIPGQIIEMVDEQHRLALVEVAGVRRIVNVGLLDVDGGAAGPHGSTGSHDSAGSYDSIGTRDSVGPRDWVLIHVGFALSKVDEDEAQATLKLLEGMGRDYEQELEELKASAIE